MTHTRNVKFYQNNGDLFMKKIIFILSLCLLCLVSCGEDERQVASAVSDEQVVKFTTQMTHSYDKKYFAQLGMKSENGKSNIVVNIFSGNGDFVNNFDAGNVENFRGICWQDDCYDIWVLTGDNTVKCFAHDDEKNTWWLYDNAAIPEYMLK